MDASNVVVAFELIDCVFALADVSVEDGFDANDVVEFDTLVVELVVIVVLMLVATVTCSPAEVI